KCRGNFASPNGTPNFSATPLTASAKPKKRICAGKQSNFAPATPGIAGITRFRSAPVASTNVIRSSLNTSPITGGPSAVGACQEFRRGRTNTLGDLSTASDKLARTYKVHGTSLNL